MSSKVEIGAKILTIVFLVLSIALLGLNMQSASGSWFVSIGIAGIILVLRIAIALWLYIRANRETKYPWMWCLLGLVFGLVAVGVYFLIDIYKKVSSIQENIEKT
jgi:uncharacterized membrane protein YhaH (DUF805 family)